MKITSSLKVMGLATVLMSVASLTAQAAVTPIYTNQYTTSEVPVTFGLTFKSLTPATTIHAGTTYSQPSGTIGAPAFYDDYLVTNTNTGVSTEYTISAATLEKMPFGNAEFLAALATNGILPDHTPQGWKINVKVGSMGNLYSQFYATKGTNNIYIGQYISAQFPEALAHSASQVTQRSNNTIIGETSTGSYSYEGPMTLTLHVPTTSPTNTATYTLSGLGTGSSSDFSYTYVDTQYHSTNYTSLTVAGAFSLANGVGSYTDTNNNPVTIDGNFGFGSSKAVPVPNLSTPTGPPSAP